MAWQAATHRHRIELDISNLALSLPSSSSTELEITLRLHHQLHADGKGRGLCLLCVASGGWVQLGPAVNSARKGRGSFPTRLKKLRARGRLQPAAPSCFPSTWHCA